MIDTMKLAESVLADNQCISKVVQKELADAYIDLHKRMEKIAEEASVWSYPEKALSRILALTKGTK